MKFKSALYEFLETVFTVLILVIIIRGFIAEPRWIPSASMRPTLLEGDRVFIEKITTKYNFRDIKRGDVIVFYPPFAKLEQDLWSKFTRFVGIFDKNEAYIKRVIAVGGDEFQIGTDKKTGRSTIKINGKLINEPYLYDNNTINCTKDMLCGPTKVPEGHFLMLGDNRANSKDGRFWGFLSEDRVIGRAIVLFWPLNRIKVFTSPEY